MNRISQVHPHRIASPFDITRMYGLANGFVLLENFARNIRNQQLEKNPLLHQIPQQLHRVSQDFVVRGFGDRQSETPSPLRKSIRHAQRFVSSLERFPECDQVLQESLVPRPNRPDPSRGILELP